MSNIIKERREAYVEVLEILDNMDTYYKEKVPLNIIRHFKDNASKEYKFNIDLFKPLEEQKLKDITKNVLAMLNLNYWCETEEEKKEWAEIYARNQKNQEKLKEKYDLNDVFNKRKEQTLEKIKEDKELEEKRLQEEVTMLETARLEIVEYEETLIKKVIDKIKSFFNKY